MFANSSEEKRQAFDASIDALNAFERPSVLRKYQAHLLTAGQFTIVCPTSGKMVAVTRSTMLGGRIAYLVPGRTNSWLITGPTRFGFPLWEVITEADGKRRSLSGTKRTVSAVSEREIEALKMFRPEQVGRRTAPATLLIGEANFAHHLWNELSGLDEWLAKASDDDLATLSIVATAEPLGPLRLIFPRLSNASFEPSCNRFRRSLALSPIVAKIGSSLVTSRIRHRIRMFCQERANRENAGGARQLMENSWPRIWMSVRLGSRTPDNQKDFLLELIRAVLREYPNAAVIFDGFSFPVAFFEDPRTTDMRAEFTARAEAAAAFIEHLRDQVQQQLGSAASSRLCSASGLGLIDAIQLGASCDYYVCHAGTLQHKIAWIHNIPGLIHLPLNTKSRAQWHAAQVEDGVCPDLLPADLSVSTDPPATGRTHDRNFNYRIVDPTKAAECVLGYLESRVARPGSGPNISN